MLGPSAQTGALTPTGQGLQPSATDAPTSLGPSSPWLCMLGVGCRCGWPRTITRRHCAWSERARLLNPQDRRGRRHPCPENRQQLRDVMRWARVTRCGHRTHRRARPHVGAPLRSVGYRAEHVGAPQGQTLAPRQPTRQDTSRRARRLPLASSLGTEPTRQVDYLPRTAFLNCTLKTRREQRQQPGKWAGELGHSSQSEMLWEGGGEGCRERGAQSRSQHRGARGDEDGPGGKGGASLHPWGWDGPPRGHPAGTGGLQGMAEAEAVPGRLWEGGHGHGGVGEGLWFPSRPHGL